MPELEPSRSPAAGEQSFRNDPAAVIAEHLSRVPEPSVATIQGAAMIIRSSYPFGEALSVCLDLHYKIPEPTTTLARMFAIDHDALPVHWRTNPEVTRTVLSMSGQIEAGFLRAQQISAGPTGSNPGINARLGEVEHLVEALQQR